jgi:hypothetical protein
MRDRIFFFGGNTGEAHSIAERLGFRRGQYVVVIGYNCTSIRGMRGETIYVVGNAAARDDYTHVINEALMRAFTVVYIDDEVLNLVEG